MLKVDAVKGTTVICSNKQRQKQFRVWKPVRSVCVGSVIGTKYNSTMLYINSTSLDNRYIRVKLIWVKLTLRHH